MRIEWKGYENSETDAPSFEKILRKKPHTEFDDRKQLEKIPKTKRVPRADKD